MSFQLPAEFLNQPTPFYYYDLDLLDQTLAALTAAARPGNFRVHYALKANSNLPVLARIRAGGLVFEAGPQLSLLLAHSGGYLGDKFNPALTSSASYHTLDFGAVAGVGYQSEQGHSMGVRYNRGFNELFRNFAGILVSPYNSGFQLHAGYVFGQR